MVILPSLIIVGAFFAGCATEPMPLGSRLVISAPSAQFYKNGPAQELSLETPQMASMRTLSGDDHGADAQLPRGAAVTLLKREIGYSRVMTDNGAVGYVSNDQMQRAPSITRAATEAPAWRQQNPPPTRRNIRSQPTRPPEDQLDLSDLPLPLPS